MAVVTAADLYGLTLPAFTGERNALARRLRAEGRRDDADDVAKRRRPPVTAWALDQVARQQPSLIEALLRAGGRLRDAMEEAAGGDPGGLRAAQAEERLAVDAALDAAADHLGQAGHPATAAQRIRMAATLRAALVDPGIAGELSDGVLDRDVDVPGFGLDATVVAAPARSGPGRSPADVGEARQAARRRAAKQAEVDKLTRRAQQLADVAVQAERLAAEARSRADHAATDAAAARRTLD